MFFLSMFFSFLFLFNIVGWLGAVFNDDDSIKNDFFFVAMGSGAIAILTTRMVNVSKVKHMVNVPMVAMDKNSFPIVSDFLLTLILAFILAAIVQIVLTIVFQVLEKGEKNE